MTDVKSSNIIGILDGEESDLGFFGMRKNYIGWGEAESDIIFLNPKNPISDDSTSNIDYILNFSYCNKIN